MMERTPVKQQVIAYANKISMVKAGSKNAITPQDPEYRIFAPVMSDEMAEVGLCLELKEPLNANQVAKRCGKSVEETEALLWELAVVGAAFVNNVDGVDVYWHDVWVPGHMEMVVNNKQLIEQYPELGVAFDDFGKKRGPMAAGNVPVGSGPMRVIPIETAIDGDTRSASYEEVSKYLDDNEVFSLSDCACRASREAMGEGCGHIKDDICIQMGHAAEYYIRTGRGKSITREEAKQVIRKAEDNGLMHQIPNFDGSGETHAICNCCGCGCFALRLAEQWQNPDMIRSNYVVKIDESKCVACGECVEHCPTNAIRLGQKLCAVNKTKVEPRELPYTNEWGEDKYNPDYRINRQVAAIEGSAPCKASCPAHIGIQGYIKLAAQGRYSEALELIKKENPLPAVCGRICPKNCESECTRGDIDDPVAIDDIKKFVAQQDMSADGRYVPTKRHDYSDKKIAVIGSGPAGISCAYFLAVEGYSVTVFERQPVLGGMLTLGIPSYRLEKEVINAEIDVLRQLGVTFKTDTDVGNDVTLAELREQGFAAFYLAIGAQKGKQLTIEGSEANGVQTGVEFLREINLGNAHNLGKNVVVIGGGNVAIDVARTAVRCDVSSVTLFSLESRDEMPAHFEEVQEALDESIAIENGWGPSKVLVVDGNVVGLELVKCDAVVDENGHFAPRFNTENRKTVAADQILISVGQAIDWGALLDNSRVEVRTNQCAIANELTFQTDQPDVFVGGDALTGPRFAIDAIAQGKEGAISIHRFVQHGQSLELGRLRRAYSSFDKNNVELGGYDNTPRQTTKHVEGAKSKKTFRDLRGYLTEQQVQIEANRCLDCGVVKADDFMCVGCGACTTRCKFGAISLERVFDAQGSELRDARKKIIKYAVKRKVKVTLNKPIKKIKSLIPMR
jgi:NADPH-dependent glutamate synthase beta subunit-like oxidoreductase